ncbi:MAG: hypothetical protein ACXWCZ_06460, partial [Flavisolibacter sp.]
MNLVSFLALIILQFITGFGILNLFRIDLRPFMFISLAVILGVANFSIIPFLLQLLYIPLTSLNVFVGLLISAILFNLQLLNGIKRFRKIFKDYILLNNGAFMKRFFLKIILLSLLTIFSENVHSSQANNTFLI